MKTDFRNIAIIVLVILVIILFIPIAKKQMKVGEEQPAPSIPSEQEKPAEEMLCIFDSDCVSAGKGDKCDKGKCIYRKPIGGECAADSDCRPATCCHPNTCVPVGQEPNCNDAVCTDVCQPGTMDCGQGKCECVNSRCLAVIYG